ncbi:LysE family translocator [Anaerolineales bacterium HSG6]|nr:LysE family translocator [Anaerolineales bacterium HSG6]MDM8530495.1 LysE family translocator [Anaerolineales bacterium HSG25]
MFDTASLIIFITAALALLLAPGPAVLYIVARSLEQGRMAGIVSAFGIALGAVVHVIFAALGLSALLLKSALAFSLVKYMGAAYLIYIGIQTLRKKTELNEVTEIETMSYSRIFTQGFIVNLLNPKTALFFLAFLPQFVSVERGVVAIQIILLGTIFVGLAIVSDSLYALIAGTARHLLVGNIAVARSQKYMSGSIYILLGLTTALSGNSKSIG